MVVPRHRLSDVSLDQTELQKNKTYRASPETIKDQFDGVPKIDEKRRSMVAENFPNTDAN